MHVHKHQLICKNNTANHLKLVSN